jgi:hypothetical protein
LPAVSTLCYMMRIVKCDHSCNILSYTYSISCKIQTKEISMVSPYYPK